MISKTMLDLVWKRDGGHYYAPDSEGPTVYRATLTQDGSFEFARADVKATPQQDTNVKLLAYRRCNVKGEVSRKDGHQPHYDAPSPLQAACGRNEPYWDSPSFDSRGVE